MFLFGVISPVWFWGSHKRPTIWIFGLSFVFLCTWVSDHFRNITVQFCHDRLSRKLYSSFYPPVREEDTTWLQTKKFDWQGPRASLSKDAFQAAMTDQLCDLSPHIRQVLTWVIGTIDGKICPPSCFNVYYPYRKSTGVGHRSVWQSIIYCYIIDFVGALRKTFDYDNQGSTRTFDALIREHLVGPTCHFLPHVGSWRQLKWKLSVKHLPGQLVWGDWRPVFTTWFPGGFVD